MLSTTSPNSGSTIFSGIVAKCSHFGQHNVIQSIQSGFVTGFSSIPKKVFRNFPRKISIHHVTQRKLDPGPLRTPLIVLKYFKQEIFGNRAENVSEF